MANKRGRRDKRRGPRPPAPVRIQPPAAARPTRSAAAADAEPDAPFTLARGDDRLARRLQARTVGSDAWRARIEDQVVVLVNEVRQRHDQVRLRTDQRLRAAARGHSADMRAGGYLAHQAPDGRTAADRMTAAGYPQPAGENIACGQRGPHEVISAWMTSPGHRANILNPDLRAVGVGLEFGPGGPWWTQNFGYQ
jgi:uncharacterized protein YkwD